MTPSWVGLRSADGRWWWDGQQWLPVPPEFAVPEAPAVPEAQAPGPSLPALAPQSLAPPRPDRPQPPDAAQALRIPAGDTQEDLEAPTRALTAPDGDSRPAPEALDAAPPEAQEAATPDVREGSAPDVREGSAPDVQESSAPDVQQGSAPDVQQGPAPDVQQGSAPDVQEGSAPDVQEGSVPDVHGGSAPDVHGGSAADIRERSVADVQEAATPDVHEASVPDIRGGSVPDVHVAAAPDAPDVPTPETLEVPPEPPAESVPRPDPARPSTGMSTLFARVSEQLTPRKGEAGTVRRQQLEARARRPVATSRTIAVLSRKGGIGKTTTTVMLGHQFASIRDDRVVAIDGNPDGGTLADRVRREHGGTISHLLDASNPAGTADLRRYVSQAPSRLDVLASDADPAVNHGRTADEYRRLLDLLAEHYALVLCDTGTGVLDTATQAILDRVDQLIVCASPAIDAARIADATLDWLEQHGYEHLAAGAVVVINGVSTRPGAELGKLRMHFRRRCRAVVLVPWDRHLGTGLETSLDDLQAETRDAYRELAAEVADGLVPREVAPAPRQIAAQPAFASDDGTRRLEAPEGVNMGWRGEAARVRVDPTTGRMHAVELPRLVTGGVLADGGRALVHLTSQQDCRIWFVRVPPSPEMPIQVDVVLEAPGLVSDARGPHGRPVYVLTGAAGPYPARTLLEAGTAHVYGLDLPADVSSQPAPRPAETVVIPGLVQGGVNLAGRPVSVLETRLHLVLATVVTDEAGMPLALDVPGYPEAEGLRF